MTSPSEQPVAMIIGGGSGIGADAAKKMHELGYAVAILSSSGKGEALAQSLGGYGFTGSNLEPADLSAFVEGAMDRFGRIDALINCAGHGPKGPVLEISDEDWHLGLDYYLLNVIRATRLVAPIMVAQGSGAIVNVSTFAVFEPDPDFPTSAVFRAGSGGLHQAVRRQARGRRGADEQRAAGFHRQPAREAGPRGAYSRRALCPGA